MSAAGAKASANDAVTVADADAASAISTQSDAELVRAFQTRQDGNSFSELVRRHQIPTYRLLVGYLGDADEAEPLCERVFVEASQRIDELADPAAFDAWLFRLASEGARKAEAEAAQSGRAYHPPPPLTAAPHTHLKHEIREVLRTLPGDQRLALVLSELHQSTPERVAVLLRLELGEAEALIERARVTFMDALARREAAAPQAAADAAALTRVTMSGAGHDDEDEDVIPKGSLVAGRYRVRRLLGVGGFGAVYDAVDERKRRAVALKVLLASVAARSVMRKRFKREAALIRRVQHENFVRVYDYGHAREGYSYMSMELIEGESLAQLMDREILEPERALRIIRHTLRALAHAHKLGVIHRDIKPGNLMITRRDDDDSFVRVLDLGIAKLVDREDARSTAKLSRTGQILGTPAYMSPEQASGEAIDARSDLYSVAVMLFEMLTARAPFEAASDVAMLAMQVAKPAPMLADLAPGRPWTDEIEAVMRQALAKEPGGRFASADQFLAALDGITLMTPGAAITHVPTSPQMPVSKTSIGETLNAVPPVTAPSTAGDGGGLRRVLVIVAAVALLVATAIGIAVAFGG